MAFLHSAQLLYTDCGYPRWTVCFTMPNAVFFYLLFNDFYKKSYNKPVAIKTTPKKSNGHLTNGTAKSESGEETNANGHVIEQNNNNASCFDNKKTE